MSCRHSYTEPSDENRHASYTLPIHGLYEQWKHQIPAINKLVDHNLDTDGSVTFALGGETSHLIIELNQTNVSGTISIPGEGTIDFTDKLEYYTVSEHTGDVVITYSGFDGTDRLAVYRVITGRVRYETGNNESTHFNLIPYEYIEPQESQDFFYYLRLTS